MRVLSAVGWGKVLSNQRFFTCSRKKGTLSASFAFEFEDKRKSVLHAFLKQQIMKNFQSSTHLSASICVQKPTFLLPFLNSLAYIFVMTNLDTFIFFQLNYHPLPVSIISTSLSRFGYNFSAKPKADRKRLMEVSSIFVVLFSSFRN